MPSTTVDLTLATSFTLAGRAWVLLLMLPLGFMSAFLSSISEGKSSIRTILANQQAIKAADEGSSD